MLLLIGAALVLAACTSSAPASPSTSTSTSTRTVVITHSATPTKPYTPPPASTVHRLAPGATLPSGEKAGSCPYIRGGLDVEPGGSQTMADIEGNRVGRITQLTRYRPVGCRFYFAYPPYRATADILPTTFATADQARNAMVRTARQGTEAQTYANFTADLTGISYRTLFYEPDKGLDWAFVFVKKTVMVVVHTDQNRSSAYARYVAAAIAGKF